MLKQDFEYSILIIATLFGAFVISETLRWLIKRTAHIKAKKLKIDPTSYSFFKNATSFVIYTTAIFFIIYSVPRFKALGATLFAGAGIFAAIIALASQQAFSNIISGIFIVISKPFRVGDYIELNPLHKGNIEDITLRHTIIRDVQNNRIIVPNSKINSETIVNFHLNEEMKKEKIEYCIDVESDLDLAIRIIKEEVEKHPDYLKQIAQNSNKKDLQVRLVKIENGSVRLRIMVDSEDSDTAYNMHCDLNYSIKKRFDEAGISFEKRANIQP